METEANEFREPTFEASQKKAIYNDDIPMIPKRDRILIIQNNFVQRSVIYIPDTAQAKPTTGIVVAIGPDVEDGFVRLGEVVVFSLYGGVEINIVNADGEVITYRSLTPDEVAGELIVDPTKLKVDK